MNKLFNIRRIFQHCAHGLSDNRDITLFGCYISENIVAFNKPYGLAAVRKFISNTNTPVQMSKSASDNICRI